MSKFSFKTPDVGEGIVEVELIAWHIAVGDGITEDQPIADVMTDKANVELSSPVAGRVLRLACPELCSKCTFHKINRLRWRGLTE